MTRRSGITLVEVLVAIFVMGIGLMALLTLFPIGMLRMAQSIRDARSVDAAEAAYAIALMQDIRNDPAVVTDADLFKNPYPTGFKNADPYGESYPIMVDPIGYKASPPGFSQDWVGSVRGLRRRPVAFTDGPGLTLAQQNLNVYKSFTLWDDINFDSTTVPGAPQTVTGTTTVLRDTRYSWAYVYQRPCSSDRSVVECTVVVFDKRSLALNNSLSLAETAYPSSTGDPPTYFNPNNNTITIAYNPATQQAPALRPGAWILDASLVKDKNGDIRSAHAYFYRVVSSEDFVIGGKNYARYEVQQPIRGFVNTATVADPINTSQTAYQGTAIVIENIADVYEKGPVRLP